MIDFNGNIPEIIQKLSKEHGFDKIFLLADSNTVAIAESLQIPNLNPIHICIVPAGEQHKTLSQAMYVWEFLSQNGANRKSLLINVGGGMITDLGGFCGSTYMRGIKTYNIPTSLLAMVDASVGGKTGVNHQHLKNQIGTFHNPIGTSIHAGFLETLPKSEFINGWAEVIKHGIISGGELWSLVKQGLPEFNDKRWPFIIEQNVSIKLEIVQKDPQESGLRKLLNFGHTIGHALESCFLSHNDFIGHGHAVAAGMVIESTIANQLGMLSNEILNEIKHAIDSTFDRLILPATWFDEILALVKLDKKNSDNQIFLVLPKKIGDVEINIPVNPDVVLSALTKYAET